MLAVFATTKLTIEKATAQPPFGEELYERWMESEESVADDAGEGLVQVI